MGFFGKDRHGKMHTVVKGYKFLWEIPNIKKYNNTVLDGENVPSFSNVQFHFHMTVNPKGEIGFYLHYKGPPIPKYSYYFAAKEHNPSASAGLSWFPAPGTSATKVSRQFTAHTIPAETERCGHWNVLNPEQLDNLLEGTDGTLMVVFQFDEDIMAAAPVAADMRYQWQVPKFRHVMCSPFTSKGIIFNNQLFVLRMDRKGVDGDYFCFVFSKSMNLPPMSMRIMTQQGIAVASMDKPEDPSMPLPPLLIPRDIVVASVKSTETLIVELIVYKAGNPLDQLNMGGKFESVMSPPRAQEPRTAQVGSQQYVVVSDDL